MQGPLAASALAKSLAVSKSIVGELAKAAGTSELQSPTRSASQASSPGKCSQSKDCDTVTLSPEALELSREEQLVVRDLQSRDAEVRSHENAHAGAGGAAAGAPSFTYEKGPDGRQYATAGEVPIQVERGATPEETLRNASQVRAAALAPSDPSSADRSVAAQANALEMEARREIAQGEGDAEEATVTVGAPADAPANAPADAASIDPRALAYAGMPSAAVEPVLVDLFG